MVYPIGERQSWDMPVDMQCVLLPLMEKHLVGRPKNKDHIPSKGGVLIKYVEKVKRKRTLQLSTSQAQTGIRSSKGLVTPEDQEKVKRKKASTSQPQRRIRLVKDQ
nr:hypothetical protein [Tanacetum cinerariifolium]